MPPPILDFELVNGCRSFIGLSEQEIEATKITSECEVSGRRVSSRLQQKRKPFYGVPKVRAKSSGRKVAQEKAKNDVQPSMGVAGNVESLKDNSRDLTNRAEIEGGAVEKSDNARVKVAEKKAKTDVQSSQDVAGNVESLIDNSRDLVVRAVFEGGAVEKSDNARVKETLRIFNSNYLHFVQEEEKRCKKIDIDESKTSKGLKSRRREKLVIDENKASEERSAFLDDAKRVHKRPDLKAITKMIFDQTVLYPEKKFGPLPGIDVGHQFFSRAEMVVVGLHGHWLNGIDYMGASYQKMEKYKNYKFPLAVSIVMSGMYEDDCDKAEEVTYTGQGGHDLLGSKSQIRDQVMARGNLALKHNVEHGVPVRVTRGHESANSYCGKVYTYDGLYKVIKYWAEKGKSGFTIFKYKLKRLEGQPTLTTNQVHFTRKQAPKSLSELRGLVCEDICGGQENIPIPATNEIDDLPVVPTGYVYSKNVQVSKGVKLPMDAPGCKCEGHCVDPNTCACAKLNGFEFPYVRKDGGRLVTAKSVVFECGPNCGCGPDCINRVSQNSLRYRLEVFRTPKKGWAVRSWDSIPSGAPVCEYTGILRRTDEIDSVSENNFIFDIDCLQTMKGLDGRERRLGDVPMNIDALEKIDDNKAESVPEFCIDAGSVGNVARFINHSCQPNLFVQCVLSSHHDIKLARVLLFAADNIPPLHELTYNYGYALDSVTGPDGKIKKMLCYCGILVGLASRPEKEKNLFRRFFRDVAVL